MSDMTLDKDTLLKVAAWCNEEYRRICMLPLDRGCRSESAVHHAGMRAQLADLEFGLKRWAETGQEPAHQKVLDEWRIAYERQAREDAVFLGE